MKIAKMELMRRAKRLRRQMASAAHQMDVIGKSSEWYAGYLHACDDFIELIRQYRNSEVEEWFKRRK